MPRTNGQAALVTLPEPRTRSEVSLEQALRTRRSCRIFEDRPLGIAEAGQLLWAAQGITGVGGLRTAPSPAATYPMDIYVSAGSVEGLAPGAYRYDPDRHVLTLISRGSKRRRLRIGADGQVAAEEGALVIVLAAAFRRMTEFGPHAPRLAHIEAGHIAQNVCLQATAMGLGVVGLARLDAGTLRAIFQIPEQSEPLFLIAAGHKWD